MYIERLEISNYENEVSVDFTNDFNRAKKYNEDQVDIYIDILVTLFGDVEFLTIPIKEEEKENKK